MCVCWLVLRDDFNSSLIFINSVLINSKTKLFSFTCNVSKENDGEEGGHLLTPKKSLEEMGKEKGFTSEWSKKAKK